MSVRPPIRSAVVHDDTTLHFSATTKKNDVLELFLSIHRVPQKEDECWEIEVSAWNGADKIRQVVILGPQDGARIGAYDDILLPRDGVNIPLPSSVPPASITSLKNNPILTLSTYPGQLRVKSAYFNLIPEPPKTKTDSTPLTPPETP